jgi:plastocyanin
MKYIEKVLHSRTGLFTAIAIIAAVIGFGAVFTLDSHKVVAEKTCNGICVALEKNKAVPDTLAVKLGSFVQFNSADGKTHDLSFGKGGEHHEHTGTLSSGDIHANEGWRVQLKNEGTFYLHDHLNPKINILVVVYVPGKDYKIH